MTRPGYKQTELGEIPLEWEVKKLEELAREVDLRFSDGTDVHVLSVTKHLGFVESLKYFNKRVFSKNLSNYKLVKKGQFAYATIHLDEGSIALLETFDSGLISPMYTVFETEQSETNLRFLSYKFKSPEMLSIYGRVGQGSIDRRKSIGFDAFKKIQIFLPPLPEQQKIAHILESVDRTLEATRGVIAALEGVRRGLMQQLFSRGIPGRHSRLKQTELGEIPLEWEVLPLSECAIIQTGLAKGKKYKDQTTVWRPYLRVANVQDNYFDLGQIKLIEVAETEISRYELKYGDVLMTEGGDADKLGRGHIWHNEIPGCLHQNHLFCVRVNAEVMLPEYFNALTSSDYGKTYFLRSAKQSTNLASINSSQLKAFPCLLPTLEEQKEIISILARIKSQLEQEKHKLAALEEVKKALMQALLSGRVRVQLGEETACT